MRGLGFLLVALGFLGGALASVLNETTVRWDWFVPAVAVGFVGRDSGPDEPKATRSVRRSGWSPTCGPSRTVSAGSRRT